VAASVTEALRIDLSRSPTVRLIESGDVAATLRQMRRDPATPLTAQVAREVAERGGATAVVTGEIASLGTGYVLSVRLIGTKDGATLLAERESAPDAAGLIPAVDKLSRKVREGIGESLRSIRGGEPLAQVTTGSLEALRKYSQAERAADAGQYLESQGLLEEAIRIDSGFAMAHRKLAVVLGNMGIDNERTNAEVRRAYQLRERLPERERLLATAYYFSTLDYDSDKTISAYRLLLETWPDEYNSLNNLSLELYLRHRYAEAEEMARRGIVGAPTVGVLYTNALAAQVSQGKFAAADSTFQQWSRNSPGSAQRQGMGSWFAYAKGDYDVALAHADSAGLLGDPVWQARSHHARADIFRTRGQIGRAAEEELAESRILRGIGAKGQALTAAIEWATIPGDHLGHPDVAVRRLDSVLTRNPLDSLAVVDRPYLNLAVNFVRQGAADRAERLLAEYDRVMPSDVKKGDFLRIYAGALVALGRQRYEEALSGFHEYMSRAGGELFGRYEIAKTFDAAGRTDSALAAYQQYASTPELGPSGRQYNLPRTFRRLGELYEGKHNREKALEYYGKFAGLWKDADPELQPQVREVKQRMAALVAEPRKP
jgi:tetratricopeptide (TPR) repeat protein